MCFKCLFTLWVFGFDELLYIFKSQFLMLKMEIVFFSFFFFPPYIPIDCIFLLSLRLQDQILGLHHPIPLLLGSCLDSAYC